MQHTIITLSEGVHRGKGCILLHFPFNFRLKEYLKTFEGMHWSQSKQCFYVREAPNIRLQLEQHIRQWAGAHINWDGKGRPSYSQPQGKPLFLPHEKAVLLEQFQKFLIGKRYSTSTLKVYSGFVRDFLQFHKDVPPSLLNGESVRHFIEGVVPERNYSISTHRQLVSALRHFAFFYPECAIDPEKVLRPKKDRRLPTVLSMEEVMRLLRVTKNIKHKTIIALLYSSGLRVGELIDLELNAFDLERRQLHVRQAKGRKDRYTQLAESMLPLLRLYYDSYRPQRYFIEGPKGGKYSASSIRAFIWKNCKLARITKVVTPHTLRHSYATHLLESGTGLRYIQELLGHSKPETTMIYTHVRSLALEEVKSPLDLVVQKYKLPDKANTKHVLSPWNFQDNLNKK